MIFECCDLFFRSDFYDFLTSEARTHNADDTGAQTFWIFGILAVDLCHCIDYRYDFLIANSKALIPEVERVFWIFEPNRCLLVSCLPPTTQKNSHLAAIVCYFYPL
jgi:hypothetical protein